MQFNCEIILIFQNRDEKNAHTMFSFLNDLATNQIDPCSQSIWNSKLDVVHEIDLFLI